MSDLGPGSEIDHRCVVGDRVELIAWNLALIDAFEANDSLAAELAFNAQFPDPFRPPPETDDVLGFFRGIVQSAERGALFAPRMIVRKWDRMSVGSIGITPPDQGGHAMIGYSVYPEFEGNGYASESAKTLVEYGLAMDGIIGIYATIHQGNIGSEIVAGRAGLMFTGEERIEGDDHLNVWRRLR
jgi:RimJ/RimL family protein N-acetyltransferase